MESRDPRSPAGQSPSDEPGNHPALAILAGYAKDATFRWPPRLKSPHDAIPRMVYYTQEAGLTKSMEGQKYKVYLSTIFSKFNFSLQLYRTDLSGTHLFTLHGIWPWRWAQPSAWVLEDSWLGLRWGISWLIFSYYLCLCIWSSNSRWSSRRKLVLLASFFWEGCMCLSSSELVLGSSVNLL